MSCNRIDYEIIKNLSIHHKTFQYRYIFIKTFLRRVHIHNFLILVREKTSTYNISNFMACKN